METTEQAASYTASNGKNTQMTIDAEISTTAIDTTMQTMAKTASAKETTSHATWMTTNAGTTTNTTETTIEDTYATMQTIQTTNSATGTTSSTAETSNSAATASRTRTEIANVPTSTTSTTIVTNGGSSVATGTTNTSITNSKDVLSVGVKTTMGVSIPAFAVVVILVFVFVFRKRVCLATQYGAKKDDVGIRTFHSGTFNAENDLDADCELEADTGFINTMPVREVCTVTTSTGFSPNLNDNFGFTNSTESDETLFAFRPLSYLYRQIPPPLPT